MKLVSWLRSENTLDEGKQEILIFVKLVVDAPVVLFYLGYSFTSHALSICWFPAFPASRCLTALINTSNSLTLFSWKEIAKLQHKVLLKVTPVYLSSIISALH